MAMAIPMVMAIMCVCSYLGSPLVVRGTVYSLLYWALGEDFLGEERLHNVVTCWVSSKNAVVVVLERMKCKGNGCSCCSRDRGWIGLSWTGLDLVRGNVMR